MTYSVWYHGTTQENVASIPAKGLPLAMTAEPESWPFVTGQRVLHHPAGKGAGDGGGAAGDTQLLVDVFQVGAVSGPGTVSSAPALTRTIVVGGMPGWQIALIAVGAALLTATLAVLADRVRAAHRETAPAS